MSKEIKLIRGAGLVLEGGGMRGLYTAGVLDAFLEEGLVFNNCIGVSAGICHACSYYSLQHGRAMHVNLDYLGDKNYCSIYSLLKTGDLFGADFLYRKIPEELYPIDNDAFLAHGARLWSTVTNCETGEAEYKRIGDMYRDVKWVRASASLPLVSRIVEIEGKKYLDGGITDAIPIRQSEKLDCEKNIIILTQPRDYRKKPQAAMGLIKLKYRKYKKLVDAIENRHNVYNETLEYIESLEKAGKALIIAPEEPLGIGRVEKDRSKLMAIYELGREDGHKAAGKIQKFAET